MGTEPREAAPSPFAASPWDTALATGFAVAAAGGILLVVTPDLPALAWLNRAVARAFFGGNGMPDAAAGLRRWLYAVEGSTLAAFGVLGLGVARTAFRRRERWSRNALALAVSVWFPLDTAASIAYGVWANVALNALIGTVLLLPVVATWRRFDAEPLHGHATPSGVGPDPAAEP